MRFSRPIVVCLLLMLLAGTVHAQLSYLSQPWRVYVFLNDVAYVQDALSIPPSTEAQIILPPTAFVDTLVLNEDGQRVPVYRTRPAEGGTVVEWGARDRAAREVTFSYLMTGVGWNPTYDMTLDTETRVTFDFFAEIRNNALDIRQDMMLLLVNGRVDTTQRIDAVTTITANQVIAGYEQSEAGSVQVGAADIQHIYQVAPFAADPGETIYARVNTGQLDARRLLLWNAVTDNEVTIIYKVRNGLGDPIAEGIVRTYRDNLFLGSDFIELTPLNGEGSVTIGTLQTMRVRRGETREAISGLNNTLHTVTLTLDNFDEDAVTIEVVDSYPADAEDFEFDDTPERQPGNLLRWEFTLEPGETRAVVYRYRS